MCPILTGIPWGSALDLVASYPPLSPRVSLASPLASVVTRISVIPRFIPRASISLPSPQNLPLDTCT